MVKRFYQPKRFYLKPIEKPEKIKARLENLGKEISELKSKIQ